MAEDGLALDGVEDAYPLTAAQAGMLFHTLAEPGTGVYIGLFRAGLPADLDVAAFKEAWQRVALRHQAMRSVFVWEGLEKPVQVVLDEPPLRWEDIGWPDDPAEQEALLIEALQGGVDARNAPATRFVLMRGQDGALQFVWLCHHALIDVWSAALVMGEVAQVYGESVQGQLADLPKPMPFRDFVDWSASADEDAGMAFWARTLGDFNEPALLQLAAPESAQAKRTPQASTSFVLDPTVTARLTELARSLRVTPSAVIGAVWGVVLHRLTSQDDVLFGVAVTLRPPELDGADKAVGNFVTTLPSRVDVAAHTTLHALIKAYHDHLLTARLHATLPLNEIRQLSALPKNQPLFETILSVETRTDAFKAAGTLFEKPAGRDRSNFPLSVIVALGETLSCTLLYDTDRFTADAVELVSAMLEEALGAALSQLDDAPVDLCVLPPETDTAPLEGDPLPDLSLVHQEILARAQETPDKIALVGSERALSYAALDAQSKEWAAALVEQGIGSDDRVAIYLQRDPLAIVAMLAALRAGCAYVPIDAGHGSDRTNEILRSCKAKAVLTTTDLKMSMPAVDGTIFCLDQTRTSTGTISLPDVDAQSTAYIIYTSGSTGRPKGVGVTHANLSASTAARLGFYDVAPESFLLLSSIAFDSSVVGIYWTLTTGGTLVLPNAGSETDVPALCHLIHERSVTHLLGLPSLLELICNYAPDGQLASLTTGISAGEELTDRCVMAWREALPDARLYNEYGPTEATVWCVAMQVTGAARGASQPIGRPIPGTRVQIRDGRGRVVPNGLPGELWVGGPNISEGYVDDPKLTAEAFVADPAEPSLRLYRTGDLVRLRPDGMLEYLGRVDQQVKIRGHRIELGEIEAFLSALPEVDRAVVNPFLQGRDLQLAAYVVPEHGSSLTADDLRARLRKALPSWMVPARFVTLADVPKTATGKIDRGALPPPPDTPLAALRMPETPLQRDLAAIWQEVLWLDRDVGIDEDFAQLGGHSLLSIRLINEIENRLQVRLPIAQIGKLTTIADQAEQIETHGRTDAEGPPPMVPQNAGASGLFDGLDRAQWDQMQAYMAGWPGEPVWEGAMYRGLNLNGQRPPLFWCFNWGKEFAQLAEALGPDQPLYGTRSGHLVLDISPDTQQRENRRIAMQSVAEVLRIQPEGPYFVGGNCQGAAVAMETAQVLQGLALPVGLVLMMEAITDHVFHGPVALIFGDASDMNPYAATPDPDEAWRQRYLSYSFDTITGGHGQFFNDQNVTQLARAISRRLAEARDLAEVSGTASGSSAEASPEPRQSAAPQIEAALEKAMIVLLDEAETARKQGQPQQAAEILQAALKLQPGHFKVQKNLALTHLDLDEIGPASRLIDAALRQQDDPELRVHLARLQSQPSLTSRLGRKLRSTLPGFKDRL